MWMAGTPPNLCYISQQLVSHHCDWKWILFLFIPLCILSFFCCLYTACLIFYPQTDSLVSTLTHEILISNGFLCQVNLGRKMLVVGLCHLIWIVFITNWSPAFLSRLTICVVQEEVFADNIYKSIKFVNGLYWWLPLELMLPILLLSQA